MLQVLNREDVRPLGMDKSDDGFAAVRPSSKKQWQNGTKEGSRNISWIWLVKLKGATSDADIQEELEKGKVH